MTLAVKEAVVRIGAHRDDPADSQSVSLFGGTECGQDSLLWKSVREWMRVSAADSRRSDLYAEPLISSFV